MKQESIGKPLQEKNVIVSLIEEEFKGLNGDAT